MLSVVSNNRFAVLFVDLLANIVLLSVNSFKSALSLSAQSPSTLV